MARQPSQRVRLLFLLVYLAVLCWTSWTAMDSVLPPTSARGLWFYAGFASLLLGSLLVSPYFTKPADAFSNGVAALIGLFAAWPDIADTQVDLEQHLYWLAVIYSGIITLFAMLAIALKDANGAQARSLGQTFFALAEDFGAPRVIFSLLLVISLLLFHRDVPREYVMISTVWVAVFVIRPLEGLWHFSQQARAIWSNKPSSQAFGEVLAHQLPRMTLLRYPIELRASFGDLLYTRAPDGVPSVVMALDHIASTEGRWLRTLHLVISPEEMIAIAGLESPGDAECVRLGEEAARILEHNVAFARREQMSGLVAPDTDIERLRFEVVRDDLGLETGRLVDTRIGSTTVVYQVVNGVTKEEAVQQKHSRGYVIGEAVKIGCWNEAQLSFDAVNWVPLPSEPVFLVSESVYVPRAEYVGHFPRTSYPLKVDVHQLVTHNTAILGVLGSGKSFLALELVERLSAAEVKTICLDLTNQYASELGPFLDTSLMSSRMLELQAIGRAGKTNVKKNVEEGGSVQSFRAKLKEHLSAFITADENSVYILNPAALEVWKQDSKPFQDTASMATLSPAEITRLVAEVLLEVLQVLGMTSEARCCLVLEEAHSLVPEWNAVAVEGDKTATNGTAKALLQGRKFGLGCMLITQRTANVTKSILNQCNTIFALRCYDETAARFLADYLGTSYSGVLASLEDRHAVVYGRASSCKSPILVRLNDRPTFVEQFRPPQRSSTALGRE